MLYVVMWRGTVQFRAGSIQRCQKWLARHYGRFAGAYVRRQN